MPIFNRPQKGTVDTNGLKTFCTFSTVPTQSVNCICWKLGKYIDLIYIIVPVYMDRFCGGSYSPDGDCTWTE